MSAATIRLRSDLLVSPQEGPDGTIFVIKDPASERFFRFKAIEHFIAQQLDGATSPETVRERVEEKFGATLSPQILEQFINRLRGLGLVTEGEGSLPVPSRPRRRVAGDWLYLRLRLFDPERLFEWLMPKVRFLFTPGFLVFSAIMVVMGGSVTAIHWTEISREFRGLFRIESLLLAWVISLAVITAHEFSHGLTCKFFGGRVREIGFMLIYFQPAFYCNVSDAWLFPEKSKRLWVTFAGGYFEIFLWALATLIWRVTDPSTPVNHLALVVTATSAVRQFFNMNPLIKLDGYYLLSDYLNIPNLRQKAVGYWGAFFRRLFGCAISPQPAATPRERWIYRVYGLLAVTYSYWLLGLIISSIGAWLVHRYQAWGFLLFAGMVLTVFKQPLRRMLRALRAKMGAEPTAGPRYGTACGGRGNQPIWTAAGSEAQHRFGTAGITYESGVAASLCHRSPKSSQGATVSGDTDRFQICATGRGIFSWVKHGLASLFQRERAIPTSWRKSIRICGLLTLISLIMFFGRRELKISGEFVVLPQHNADIRAEAEGFIERFYVKEGQEVGAGDPVARLVNRDIDADLRAVTAAVAERQAKLKLLKIGTRPEEIELARTRHSKAEERLKYASSLLIMDRSLFEQRLVSKREFEQTEELVAVRRKELKEAQDQLDLLLAGTRPEEIEALEAEIRRLEAQERHLEEQVKVLNVASPITGVITTHKLQEKIGQHVKKGDLIAEVHAMRAITAEIAVSEKDIADVGVGQKVVLKARAHPQRSFEGTVTAVAPVASKPEEWQTERTVLVLTQLGNADLLLKSEMSGNAKIYCGEKRMMELLFRRFTRFLRVEFWSWW